MVLNYIWITFFVVAFVVALCKLLFLGDVQVRYLRDVENGV